MLLFGGSYLHLLAKDGEQARSLFCATAVEGEGTSEEDEPEEANHALYRVAEVLQQLHETIGRLDQKGLFPYRPRPLLMRLNEAITVITYNHT